MDQLVQDFVSRGIVLLAPESLGIPPDVHERLYKKEKKLYHEQVPANLVPRVSRVSPASVPDVLDVLKAPGLISACNQLVGENWAIVPYTHNASFASGSTDQTWHKDDNSPFNGRKQRHHQAVQIEMLYYPQLVREDMGPTATIPYSHYWAFDHEENHDNFAGADHLDFDNTISGLESVPISGSDSKYNLDDIVNRNTPQDIRMRDAVKNTGWPLVEPFEAAPLRAGSVLLYSHNTFHRGNHRRDDWRSWHDNPRFMWRFWLYRTTDSVPLNSALPAEVNWNSLNIDPLTNIDLSKVSDDVTVIWRYHNHWMKTYKAPPPRPETLKISPEEREKEATRLFLQLHTKNEEAEPLRIGAAYKLASIGDSELAIRMLGRALYTERESVRRAATYGLIAAGPDATSTFLKAITSPVKWVRKAGVYGLGDASPLTDETFLATVERLQLDPSVYVRSVAAGTLGCLGRRAIATKTGTSLIPACLDALVQSLSHEENRLAMDRAQGRSIKFTRPTDDCDVCEGGCRDLGIERFKPVRSAVRENVLWSIVILCSHGSKIIGTALEPLVLALKEVVRIDENIISVGFAIDALSRLANLFPEDREILPLIKDLKSNFLPLLEELPIHCWETLIRSGLDKETESKFNLTG